MQQHTGGNMDIYPNPVVRKAGLQFDRELKGPFTIQLINLAGQVVYNRLVRLNNQSAIQVDLPNPPPPGIYYLQVTSNETRQAYGKKLLIQR
jgi:hypothetical protein